MLNKTRTGRPFYDWQSLQRPSAQCTPDAASPAEIPPDVLARLEEMLLHGDDESQAMAYALIVQGMHARMVGAQRPSLDHFIDRLQRAVDSFNRYIR